MNEDIRRFEQACREKIKKYPSFKAGDTVEITCEYDEGAKKTTQVFKGLVIQRRHPNTNGETFTVRKISDGIAVEKIFSILSPTIKDIKLVSRGKVRRARIFYIRNKKGKDSKVKTLFTNKNSNNLNAAPEVNVSRGDDAATPEVNVSRGDDAAAPVAGQQDK